MLHIKFERERNSSDRYFMEKTERQSEQLIGIVIRKTSFRNCLHFYDDRESKTVMKTL